MAVLFFRNATRTILVRKGLNLGTDLPIVGGKYLTNFQNERRMKMKRLSWHPRICLAFLPPFINVVTKQTRSSIGHFWSIRGMANSNVARCVAASSGQQLQPPTPDLHPAGDQLALDPGSTLVSQPFPYKPGTHS